MVKEDWRLDGDGHLDDIVVLNVKTFRMERMSRTQWWIGLNLADGRMVHIDLAHHKSDGVTATRRDDD